MVRISVGVGTSTGPDPGVYRGLLRLGRLVGMDSLVFFDHLQDFTPRAVWRSSGFSWLAESQVSPHAQAEPFVFLANLARSAGRVRLGVGVTETMRHHPVTIAQSAVTLAMMTKRRPILGLGAGERMNTEPYGIPFDRPVSRFEEGIQIIRRCLDQPGSLDFAGRFFSLDSAPFDLSAPVGKPEVWVAAHGPRMLRITGRYADGWLPALGSSPARYEDCLRVVHESARQAGRDPAAITPSLQIGMVLAPTTKEAAEALHSRNTAFHAVASGSPEAWRAAGVEHPLGPSYRGFVDLVPETLDIGLLETAMENVPDEVLQKAYLWGTVDDVVTAIRELGDAGLRHISLIPSSYPISKRLANYIWRAFPSLVRRLRR